MEENVALDTSKQKQFVKSIKGIKKLIKKAEGEVPETAVPKAKDEKKTKKKRPERGLVYLSHIPHGFYEHEMTQYFKQFGAVSNVRVIRSKRTGNSMGFAFVEFKQPAVAEIVAETMNNYLMGKRLIKAAYVPPEKQRPKAMRKHWNRLNNPGNTERLKHKKAHNENKDKAGELQRAKKTLSTYKKNMKKLSDLGINYDFFTPVDIPEELVENKDSQKTAKIESSSKKSTDKDSKSKKRDKNIEETKKSAPAKKETIKDGKTNPKKEKNKVPEPVVNKKEQKQKKQKLKDAGVKLPENFIKVQEDDSDSSANFDSDNYNIMLENDSDVESGDESEDEESGDDDIEQGSGDEFQITGSDDDDSDVDESEDEQDNVPPKKSKGKGPIAPPAPVPPKKQAKQMKEVPKSNSTEPKKAKQIEKVLHQKGPKAPKLGKRKASQKTVVSPKKPKFEKLTQQPMKKQFKKKK